MAAENTVIIDVDLHAQDAITQATRIGGSLKSLIESNKALRAEGKQTGAMYQTNAQAIQQLQREQKSYITLANAERGSNVQLRAQLSLLTQQYDAMASAERDGTTAGRGLELQIKSIRDELLRTESATGRFQRNVGNYASGLGGTLQQFASSSIGNTGFGSFIPQSAAIGGAYSAVAKAVGFATAAIKAQDEAVQLQNIHNAKAIELTEAETVAQQATADAIAARTAAESALAEEQTARLALQTELSALEGVYLEEQEAEAAILTQLAAEQAVLDAAERTRIANEQALVASTTELTATEELRVATETEVAASTAASSAASEAAAAKQTALGSSFTLAGGIIIAAVLAIGAAVSKFLFTLDSVSDGFDQFKAQASGAFTELGRQIANAYDSGGIGGVLKKIFTDFGSITKATSEAGKEMKAFTAAFQDLEDRVDVNDNQNQSIQNQVQLLRLQARNRGLDNADRQKKLQEADDLERGQFEKTKKLHADIIDETIKYANQTGRLKNQITEDDRKELEAGNLQRANELLNANKIDRDAYKRFKDAFAQRLSDQQQGNQALEKIQNDQDKFAQQAQAKEQKRAEELEKINQDEIKSKLATAATLLTTRQKEVQDINADIDKRVALYQKYGHDTVALEQERTAKLKALTEKYYNEDQKVIKTALDKAYEIRIGLIANQTDRTERERQIKNQKELQDVDTQIIAINEKVAKGEQDQNGVLSALYTEKQAIIDKQNQSELDAAVTTGNQLLEQRQKERDDQADFLAQQKKSEFDKANQTIELNLALLSSYEGLYGAISGLVGQNTLVGKIAFGIEKGYAAARVIIAANEARAKIAFNTAVAVSSAEAASFLTFGASLLAIPFILSSAAAETAAVTVNEVASLVTIAGEVVKNSFAVGGQFVSDGKGAVLPGYSKTDNVNAKLRDGEGIVVSEAMRNPWARNLVSAVNVMHGGRDFSTPSGTTFALGGQYNDINAARSQNLSSQLTSAQLLTAIRTMPAPIVLVQDINDGLSQQAKVQDNASF